MKKAPFINKQPTGTPYEVQVIAGADAWNKTYWQTVKEWTKAESDYQPVVIGSEQLEELKQNRLKLAVDVGMISIFKAGNLKEADKTALCRNIATHSSATTICFYDEACQMVENASEYIKSLRGQSEKEPISESVLLSEKPTQKEIMKAFIANHDRPLAYDRLTGKCFEFTGIYWERLEDEDLKSQILQFLDKLDADYTSTRISNIADLVKLKVDRLPDVNNALIGFSNGVLNKLTGDFREHSRDDYLRGIEHYEINLESTDTPYFDDWLEYSANGNELKKQAFLAGLYMVLTNQYKWQYYLEVTGVARAGKSVFEEIATILNGRANTAVLDIAGFDDPIRLAKTVGKTLILSPDQKPYIGTADGLKNATGGGLIAVRNLYRDEIQYRPRFVFVYSTNHPISFTDRNGGHGGRRITYHFNRAVPVSKRDPQFTEKVQREIYGIVRKLLTQFTPEQAKNILIKFIETDEGVEVKREANHLTSFASHFYIDNNRAPTMIWGSTRTKKGEHEALYKAYLLFCECLNQKPINLATFRNAFPDAFKESGEKGRIITVTKDGYSVLNVHWKDYHKTRAQWENG